LPFAEVIGGKRLTEPEWAVITVHPFACLQTLTVVTDYKYKMPNLHIPVYRRTTADLCHIARYYSDQRKIIQCSEVH